MAPTIAAVKEAMRGEALKYQGSSPDNLDARHLPDLVPAVIRFLLAGVSALQHRE